MIFLSALLAAQTCSLNMQHQECGSTCVDTCSNPQHSQVCEDHCVAGCFCPEGKMESPPLTLTPTSDLQSTQLLWWSCCYCSALMKDPYDSGPKCPCAVDVYWGSQTAPITWTCFLQVWFLMTSIRLAVSLCPSVPACTMGHFMHRVPITLLTAPSGTFWVPHPRL